MHNDVCIIMYVYMIMHMCMHVILYPRAMLQHASEEGNGCRTQAAACTEEGLGSAAVAVLRYSKKAGKNWPQVLKETGRPRRGLAECPKNDPQNCGEPYETCDFLRNRSFWRLRRRAPI